MRSIALFVEDIAHEQVIGALVRRVARERNVPVRLDWRNARHGHGKVVVELRDYLRDLRRQSSLTPDMIIVGTDANCRGLNDRINDLSIPDSPPAPMVLAIPDPHIERWLLLDGAAFKAVFGRGCDAPDQKCNRDRYKMRLIEEITAAGITPSFSGIEYAEDIVEQMDIDRAARIDASFGRFLDNLRTKL